MLVRYPHEHRENQREYERRKKALLLGTFSLIGRSEGVHVASLWPGHRKHFNGSIELHGATTKPTARYSTKDGKKSTNFIVKKGVISDMRKKKREEIKVHEKIIIIWCSWCTQCS